MDSSEKPERLFSNLSRELKSIALNNIQYFQNGKQSHHAKFHMTFSLLREYLDIGIEPSYLEICKHLCSYDFSEQVKGNGYRSLLRVVHKCCVHLLQLCKYISSVRDSILFRKRFYAKELESYVSALGQLRGVLYYALKLINYCRDGELFADEDRLNNEVAEQFVVDVETLCQESFYGRCLGFQFCESMHRPMQVLAIAMASYSEGYLETSQMMQVATSVFNSGKYFLDPELRAQQVVKVTRTADIKFCKAFWGFSESSLMQQLPLFVCPSVDVNEVITLGPDAFELPLIDGSDTVVITPPCAHTGPGHVHTRLISANLREGQQTLKKATKAKSPASAKPKSASLVIHIHGGGFVAQSSKSHEVYLREWAVTIDAPILSVDYSLAPELPFPRALEECFYAYAWAVLNCEQLGSTGEKILIVGDSAGGNLAIATAMRAASFGIRSPDVVVGVYPCTVVRYTLSPARLLSLLDPVLPVGLITRCLAAYAGINEEHPLSTPKMDDIHSQQSLTRLQLGTYESLENDWLIIAQDEGHVDESWSNVADSPCIRPQDSSVVTENTINLSGQSVVKTVLGVGLSPTSSSQQVNGGRQEGESEIFSQLIHDGSCVFPSNSDRVKVSSSDSVGNLGSSTSSPAMPQAKVTAGAACSRKGHNTSFNLVKLQERAKLVMAGAQNLFSSLTSFIPSSGDIPPHRASVNPKPTKSQSETHILSPEAHILSPEAHILSPQAHTLPPAAISSPPDLDPEVMNPVNSSRLHLPHSFSSPSDISFQTPSDSRDMTHAGPLVSEGNGSSHHNSSSKGGYICSNFIPCDTNSPNSMSSSHPDSSHPDSSQEFDTALSSPYTPTPDQVRPGELDHDDTHCTTVHSQEPTSDATDQVRPGALAHHTHCTTVDTQEPTGDANIGHVMDGIHLDNITERVGPPVGLCDSKYNHCLTSNSTQEQTDGLSDDWPKIDADQIVNDGSDLWGHEAFMTEPSLNCSLLSGDVIKVQEILIGDLPEDMETFVCEDNLSSGAVSPDMLADLPEENRQLLVDAMETLESIGSSPIDVLTSGIIGHVDKVVLDPPLHELPQIGNDHVNTVCPGNSGCDEHCVNTDPAPRVSMTDPAPHVSMTDPASHDSMTDPASHDSMTYPAPQKSLVTSKPPNTLNLKYTSSMDAKVVRSDTSVCSPTLDVTSVSAHPVKDGLPQHSKLIRSGSAPVLVSTSRPGELDSQPLSALTSITGFSNLYKTGMSPADFHKQNFSSHSPLHKLRKAPVVKNPYMSPLLAPDELLKGLNRVCIVACHLDPLLDDSVSFARRLHKLDVPVELHLVDDLPHGFLNFALLSYEAKQASDFCSKKIAELLQSTGV